MLGALIGLRLPSDVRPAFLAMVDPAVSNDASTAAVPLTSPVHRNWLWLSLQVLGRIFFVLCFRLKMRGIEKLPREGGALFLINHQSFLDPLVVGAPLKRPVSYVARDDLFHVPMIGWILRNTYVFPINRERALSSSIKEAVRRMRHGFYVGIFPEGTRNDDGRISALKPGFVALVRRGNVPVYPVGIAGSGEALPRGAWSIRMRTVRVVVGDPFTDEEIQDYAQRGQEERFVKLVHDRIEACFREAEEWRHA